MFTYSNSEDDTFTTDVPVNAGTWYVKAEVQAPKTANKYTPTAYTVISSESKKFEIKKIAPTYIAPADLTAVEGQTLADVELPDGFTWQDAGTTSVGICGTNTFKVTYTPDDTTNYEVVPDIPVTITVSEKPSVPEDNPAENDPTEDNPTNTPDSDKEQDGTASDTSKKPEASNSEANTPKTGDASNIGLYLSMTAMSMVCAVVFTVRKKVNGN